MNESYLTNERKILNDPEAIWMIEEGSGELFIQKEKGPLFHLCSIVKGDIVFGFPSNDLAVITIVRDKMTMRALDMDQFLKMEEEKKNILLLSWLHKFDSHFEKLKKDKIDCYLNIDEDYRLKVGQRCTSSFPLFPEYKNEIRWLDLQEGSLWLWNREACAIEEGSLYPMLPITWCEVKKESKILTLSTTEALLKPNWFQGLMAFHANLLAIHKWMMELKETRDMEDAKLRVILDEALLERSVKHIGSVLEQEKEFDFSPTAGPLFKACQVIGSSMGVSFEEPVDLEKMVTMFEKLELICRTSKIGFRMVKLSNEWWKKDCLSLLGFYGEDERPVALVNRKGGDYLLIDPENGQRLKVGKEVAARLSGHGYSFYASFPEKKVSGRSLVHFCLSKYRREMISLFFIGLCGSILSLIPPLLNEILFNKVVRAYDQTLLSQIIWGLLLTTISIGIFLFIRSYAVLRLMQLVDVKLEPAFWNRILSLPAAFFRGFTVGNLVQRVYAVTEIRQLVGGNIIRVIFSGLFSILYFILMLYYSISLAFVGLGVLFFALLVSGGCLLSKLKIERAILAVDGRLRGLVVGLINGVSKIRMGGAEARAFAYWAEDFSEYQTLNYRSRRYNAVITSLTASLPFFTTGLLFLALISTSKTLSLGAFIAFLAAYTPFSMAVYDAINALNSLIPIGPLWERARVLLETEPENEIKKEKPGKLSGSVSVDHINFQYQKEGPLTLHDVSFHAHPGEFIALVGPSGSGKSTLVRMLLGFDAPNSGTIYYDGKNLAKLDLQAVRKQIGTVLQNGALFSGNIYENIVCGGLYTLAEVEESLKLSGFDKDIESFPMGLHTIVQSGGGTLSVGQCQRLLISRALISKPKILIFDEATSALDNKTQDEVSKRLEEIEVTRIVIAHRLSTIKNANRIYVIEQGKVVQQGRFLELAQQKGLFKQMLQRQML